MQPKGVSEMTRNPRALALLLVAVLAMGAIAVSVAAADSFTSEFSPTLATGRQIGVGEKLTTEVGTVQCQEIGYAGTATTPTTTVSVAPIYPLKTVGGEQNCMGFGFPANIETRGCTYLFHVGAATAGAVDLVCPPGEGIVITGSFGGGVTKCTVEVPAQTGIATVTYKNIATGATREVEVVASLILNKTVKYSYAKGTGFAACQKEGKESGEFTNGTYAGNALVTGEKNLGGGVHVGIFLS